MGVIGFEDVGDGDIKHVEDEWNHGGEEGDAGEHAQQTHPSYEQQERWQKQREIIWGIKALPGRASSKNKNKKKKTHIILDRITPTFKENKAHCRHCDGHKSKSEEKSNGQCCHGAEQHHCKG